jgi:hypothetical protein
MEHYKSMNGVLRYTSSCPTKVFDHSHIFLHTHEPWLGEDGYSHVLITAILHGVNRVYEMKGCIKQPPDAGSITRPAGRQSRVLPLCHGYPLSILKPNGGSSPWNQHCQYETIRNLSTPMIILKLLMLKTCPKSILKTYFDGNTKPRWPMFSMLIICVSSGHW